MNLEAIRPDFVSAAAAVVALAFNAWALLYNSWAVSRQTSSNDLQTYIYIRQEGAKIFQQVVRSAKGGHRDECDEAVESFLHFLDCLAHLQEGKFGRRLQS